MNGEVGSRRLPNVLAPGSWWRPGPAGAQVPGVQPPQPPAMIRVVYCVVYEPRGLRCSAIAARVDRDSWHDDLSLVQTQRRRRETNTAPVCTPR